MARLLEGCWGFSAWVLQRLIGTLSFIGAPLLHRLSSSKEQHPLVEALDSHQKDQLDDQPNPDMTCADGQPNPDMTCAVFTEEQGSYADDVRLHRLKERLMSKAVQAELPAALAEEPVRLSEAQVAQVFIDLVPGVGGFLYRQQRGVHALNFIKAAYLEGWSAFRPTDLHQPLLRSMRLIVHHGFDGKPQAALYLGQVAEAFMDCQAVQARVVERVALQIRGISKDFRGQVTALVGEYKMMAARMLAFEHMAARGGPNGHNDPNHYENRLITEIGELVGMSQVDLRRAALDEHGRRRFRPFTSEEKDAAIQRCVELFDVSALLKAFAAEVSSFGEASGAESMPRQFLEWATCAMAKTHIVLDEETCTRVEVGDQLALAVFEALFLAGPRCAPGERYCGELVRELFRTEV